jgi:hypothetical protein
MILWTIQPAELYAKIIKDGYYHFNEMKIKNNEWLLENREAYDWLSGEMIKRIGAPPEAIKYPVWAWYIHDEKRKKPDLRKTGYGRKGEEMVCLEIDVPDSEVVLSDEEKWIYVLNHWYLSDARSEDEYNKDIAIFESLSENKKHEAKVDSWQNIFDIEPFDNGFAIKGRFVQATFWILKAEQIKKVQFFKAR